jgi:glutathione S-transferase
MQSTKDAYIKAHIDPASAAGQRNGGAHWAYLAALLVRSSSGYVGGGELSIGDIVLWDLLDTHLRIFEAELKQWVGGPEQGGCRVDGGACV